MNSIEIIHSLTTVPHSECLEIISNHFINTELQVKNYLKKIMMDIFRVKLLLFY